MIDVALLCFPLLIFFFDVLVLDRRVRYLSERLDKLEKKNGKKR